LPSSLPPSSSGLASSPAPAPSTTHTPRCALVDQLGIEPAAETKNLQQLLLAAEQV
jgi:hypothetical protein